MWYYYRKVRQHIGGHECTNSFSAYYAPQSFLDGKRRISFGCVCDFRPDRPRSDIRMGTLAASREVTYDREVLRHFPIEEYSQHQIRMSGSAAILSRSLTPVVR